MARSEARIAVAVWDDEDFLDLSPGAQRMFMFLLSQRDLAHTGVIALRERRWSRKAAGLTVALVTAALDELATTRFIVVDEEAEELLIRSFIRRDKVYRQPNVLQSAADQLTTVSSPILLAALAGELRRVADAEDIKADAAKIVAKMLETIGTPEWNPPPRGSRNPSETPPEGTSGTTEPAPSIGTPADDPSDAGHSEGAFGLIGPVPVHRGSENPSEDPTSGAPGERGDVTTLRRSPDPDLRAPSPEPQEPAALRADVALPQNAGQILGAWIDHCADHGVRLPRQMVGRYARAIKTAVDQGNDPGLIKHALALMLTERVVDTPGQLPRYLVKVQTGPVQWTRRLTPGEQSVVGLVQQDAEVIDLVGRFFEAGTA